MKDARFEDAPATDRPLRLRAESAEDLAVISSLLQDAVGRVGDIRWARERRRLVVVLNRFRWEDKPAAEHSGRPYERVRTVLGLDGVTAVRAAGLDQAAPEAVICLLSIGFEPAADGCGGRLSLAFAGGGTIAVEVEALEAALADATRPWAAQARQAPEHEI